MLIKNMTVRSCKGCFFPLLSLAVAILSLIIILISLRLFKPFPFIPQSFEYGLVLSVDSGELEDDPFVPRTRLGRQELRVRILSGARRGEEYSIVNTLSRSHNIEAKAGRRYIFTIREEKEETIVWLYNYNRLPVILGALSLFIILVLLIGGTKGFRSLLALLFTGVVILFVLIPLILSGMTPVPLALSCMALITVVSFLLLTGWSRKTLCAVLGTMGGIVSAGLFSTAASSLAQLSGMHMERSEEILYIARDFGIRINGFLFIAILIASLGAVMDVAVSLTSSMEEIRRHRPDLSPKELFSSGMNIGRDMIGTMINTLILAFTGSSFTLILMIAGLGMSFRQFINIPLIGIEIVQALAGSTGILLCVPLTNIASIILFHRREGK